MHTIIFNVWLLCIANNYKNKTQSDQLSKIQPLNFKRHSPPALGDNHLRPDGAELVPQISVLQRQFNVRVLSLARRHAVSDGGGRGEEALGAVAHPRPSRGVRGAELLMAGSWEFHYTSIVILCNPIMIMFCIQVFVCGR